MVINKKATTAPLELIVRLLVLGAILFFVISGITSFFKSSAEAERSFSDFALELDSARKWEVGESRQIELVMDEETFVFGFAKSSPYLHIYKDVSGNIGDEFSRIQRPSQCGNIENACVCSCKQISGDGEVAGTDGVKLITCVSEKITCKEMSPDFSISPGTKPLSDNLLFSRSIFTGSHSSLNHLLGSGFIIDGPSAAGGGRRFAVAVEKNTNTLIDVCRKTPCSTITLNAAKAEP